MILVDHPHATIAVKTDGRIKAFWINLEDHKCFWKVSERLEDIDGSHLRLHHKDIQMADLVGVYFKDRVLWLKDRFHGRNNTIEDI